MNLTRWLVVAWLAESSGDRAAAQTVEIAPVGGYRFGGGFFERVTQQEVDLDGAPAVGAGRERSASRWPVRRGARDASGGRRERSRERVCAVAALAHDRRALSGGRTAGVRDRSPGAPVPHRAPRADPLRGRRGQRDSFHRERRRRREADARAATRACASTAACSRRSSRPKGARSPAPPASASSPSRPISCCRPSSPPGSSSSSDALRARRWGSAT